MSKIKKGDRVFLPKAEWGSINGKVARVDIVGTVISMTGDPNHNSIYKYGVKGVHSNHYMDKVTKATNEQIDEFINYMHATPIEDEMLAALKAIVESWDSRSGGEREELKKPIMKGMSPYWSPSASLVASEHIANARIVIAKAESLKMK